MSVEILPCPVPGCGKPCRVLDLARLYDDHVPVPSCRVECIFCVYRVGGDTEAAAIAAHNAVAYKVSRFRDQTLQIDDLLAAKFALQAQVGQLQEASTVLSEAVRTWTPTDHDGSHGTALDEGLRIVGTALAAITPEKEAMER